MQESRKATLSGQQQAVGGGGNVPNHGNHKKVNHLTGNGSVNVDIGSLGFQTPQECTHVNVEAVSPQGGTIPTGQVGIAPPPAPWSDPPVPSDNQHGRDTDSESMPSSTHSSVLVDMGKVVGVLRTYPHAEPHGEDAEDEVGTLEGPASEGEEDPSDYEPSEEAGCERPPGIVCTTCVQEAKGLESELDDSLCGDPLVYATFVAPVQQYSTETEPSRQPSFNSRQQSFKQNSSEAETTQSEVCTQSDRRRFHLLN